MQITFIGGGNMAAAIIGGLANTSDYIVRVVDHNINKLESLAQSFGIIPLLSIPTSFVDDEIVVLAVKPQSLRETALMLHGKLDHALVVSVVAGGQIQALSRWLGTTRIIRVMPNTPSMIGSGVSGLYANTTIQQSDRKAAETIMSAVGMVFWLETESHMDDITCISGSGPAYVFYFIESMIEAAEQVGFDSAYARKIVLATFEGALALAKTNNDVQQLRANVSSKGGITERAIALFEANGVKSAIIAGVLGGRARAAEIGQQLSQD